MTSTQSTPGTKPVDLSRRRFIKLSALAALATTLPPSVFAAVRDTLSSKRSLTFYNTHTEESLRSVYWANGKYVPDSLAQIDYILRDHRTDEIKTIDTRLLDFLYDISSRLNTQQPFHIISGYRSPKTNARLRSRGRGVAKKSLHMFGKAVDIRLTGCSLSLLRQVALDLKSGGVGYYPKPDFIHIDVGRVRYW